MNGLNYPQPVAITVQSIPIDTETIWNEFSLNLWGFIRRHVRDEGEADDILQDVFLKIHTNVETLRDNGKLVSWIYQITRHAIIDHYRSQRDIAELPEMLAVVDEADDDLTEGLACSLRGMVDSLPDKYRDALLLAEFQGLPQQEVANRLDVSLSGAKSRVQRARDLLKGQLLMCCHFELDRRGKVIDYYPHRAACAESQQDCRC